MLLFSPGAVHRCVGCHRGMMLNEHIMVSNPHEKVKIYKYLYFSLTNQNSIHEEIKCRLKAGNLCYYSVRGLCTDV